MRYLTSLLSPFVDILLFSHVSSLSAGHHSNTVNAACECPCMSDSRVDYMLGSFFLPSRRPATVKYVDVMREGLTIFLSIYELHALVYFILC